MNHSLISVTCLRVVPFPFVTNKRANTNATNLTGMQSAHKPKRRQIPMKCHPLHSSTMYPPRVCTPQVLSGSIQSRTAKVGNQPSDLPPHSCNSNNQCETEMILYKDKQNDCGKRTSEKFCRQEGEVGRSVGVVSSRDK